MMRFDRVIRRVGIIFATCGMAGSASANHHLMQIQQVMGGVNGDVSAQAVQLRMRGPFQNQMQFAKLWAADANGDNRVLLIDFTTAVNNGDTGDTVLVATQSFLDQCSPTCVPDFIMQPIPESYLAAGTLTFENDAGTSIWWRLSWGGTNYTGPTTGAITNDPDGDFGVYPDPLPTANLTALLFQGDASAASTNNADDYAPTQGHPIFTNNAGDTFEVVGDQNQPICPSSATWINASTQSGEAGNLCGSDDVYWSARRATFTPAATLLLTCRTVFETTGAAASLTVNVEASIDNAGVNNVRGRLILKNQAGGADRTLISDILTTTDVVLSLTESSNAADFIDADGNVTVEIVFVQTSGGPNWQGRIDQATLEVN